MTRMAPLLRWRKRGNVSAPSPPTFYYRRDTLLFWRRMRQENRGFLGLASGREPIKSLLLCELS